MGTDKRERQKANKAAKDAQDARDSRRDRTVRLVIRIVVLAAISIGLLFLFDLFAGDDTATTTSSEATETTSTTTGPTTTVDASAGPPAWVAATQLPTACGATTPTEPPAELQFDGPDDLGLTEPLTAELITSCGTITIELDPASAPDSVNSVVFLAEEGYYDRTAMHRSVPTFVVQGGDPTATGTGNPGYSVPDEFPELDTPYPRGTVALAHSSAPDSSGSQFFIVYSDEGAQHLGSDESLLFNIVGEVVDGFDVLDAIEAIPVDSQSPAEGLFIESFSVNP